MRTTVLASILMLCSGLVFAQRAPIASSPQADVEGTVKQVQTVPGQCMPFMMVEVSAAPVRVYLGSLRYLVEQNFNPRAGDKVRVHGYKFGEDIMAATVTNETTGQTLQFRDANGWPLWRGGGMRRQPRMP
jgi:hypothetical protein